MSHAEGAYLGRCLNIEDLRTRCIMDGECWIWRGGLGHGKPCIGLVVDGRRRSFNGRRAAMILSGHRVRRDHVAMATDKCPNRAMCVNPAHTQMVTLKQARKNAKHSPLTIAKRRENGMKVAMMVFAKLNQERAEEIRRRDNEPVELLMQEYGVSRETIRNVWNGKSWKTRGARGNSVFSL